MFHVERAPWAVVEVGHGSPARDRLHGRPGIPESASDVPRETVTSSPVPTSHYGGRRIDTLPTCRFLCCNATASVVVNDPADQRRPTWNHSISALTTSRWSRTFHVERSWPVC